MISTARIYGKPKEKAPLLAPEDLQKMIITLQHENSLIALRDNALLQVGFFGGLPHNEIVNIQVKHIKCEKEGIEILFSHSKTNQIHEGQYCAIPYGN